MVESRSYNTTVAMCSCDLAPDDSDLATLAFFRGSVDECDALSEVESRSCCQQSSLSIFLCGNHRNRFARGWSKCSVVGFR